jgi:uncharacterized membrane protein
MAAEAAPPALLRLPLALALAGVALQIAYPLLHGSTRDAMTVAIVAVLAATAVAHAGVTRGPRFASALVVLTAGGGFAVEVLGVHTGFPFGTYAYSGSLGARWAGVPPVIGLAWTMLAWPAAVVATRLARRWWARVLVGAWALAVTDLFLDPQMVGAGRWTWADPSPHLPGVDAVPLTDYLGWLLVALVLSAVLQSLPGVTAAADDRVPLGLYVWLWLGWSLALVAFLGRPAAAGWGFAGMGTVGVALLRRVAR